MGKMKDLDIIRQKLIEGVSIYKVSTGEELSTLGLSLQTLLYYSLVEDYLCNAYQFDNWLHSKLNNNLMEMDNVAEIEPLEIEEIVSMLANLNEAQKLKLNELVFDHVYLKIKSTDGKGEFKTDHQFFTKHLTQSKHAK